MTLRFPASQIRTIAAQYTFDFWWEYVQLTRKLAAKARVDMRTLDKALWQYSKQNQK